MAAPKEIQENEGITDRFMDDDDFKEVVGKILLKQVYEQIREAAEAAD